MADIERLTITLPSDMATLVKGAVSDGDYASSSEVIRETLRDWKIKRAHSNCKNSSRSKPILRRAWQISTKAASGTSTSTGLSSEAGNY
jgi:Arc/MetJ-type ribon-helix-helix transcriptional regulator